MDGGGTAEIQIDSSTLSGVRNIFCNSFSENSSSVISNSRVSCENEISSIASSNAALTIENHTILTSTGNILCESGNAFPSTLLIEDSSLNLSSGEIRCTAGIVGMANLTMDQATITLESGNIISESTDSLAGANIQINDSTIVLQGAGLISNRGDMTSVINITNSNITIGRDAEILSAQTLDISGGQIQNSGIIQCLAGSILIQDGAQVLNSGIFGNVSRDISLLNSTLFTSGTVLASTYTQNSTSVLDISISTNQIHGLLSASNVSLDGSLLIEFDHPDITLGEPIPIVVSANDFTSRFSSNQFKNTPSFLSPYLLYSPNQVLVELQSSPVFFKTIALQGIAIIENTLRLEREMAFVHRRLRHEEFPSLLTCVSKDGSLIAHNSTTMDCDPHSLLVSERTTEFLARRIEEEPKRPFNIYLGPIGSVGTMKKKEGQLGNSFSSIGMLGGFDYATMLENLPFGFGFGSLCSYSAQSAQIEQHAGKFHTDFVHGNLYAVVVPKNLTNLSVNGSLGGGYEWVQMDRLVTTGVSSTMAKAKTKGPEIDALIGLQYIIADDVRDTSPGLRLTFPIFYLQYLHTSLHRFKEHGTGIFDLSVQRQKESAFWSFLGTKAGYCFIPSKNVRLQPDISLGFQRQWNSTDQGLIFSTFASPFPQEFVTAIKGFKRNSLIFGFDLNCLLYDQILIEFDYDLIKNSRFLDNAFYLQCAYQF